MLGRNVPAGLTAMPAEASPDSGLRMGTYQLVKTLKTDISRNKWLILFLNIFINHLSSKTKAKTLNVTIQY